MGRGPREDDSQRSEIVALKGLTNLPEGAALLVDTAPIAYVLDDHPFASEFASLFEDAAAGRFQLVVTPITIAEVVAGPLREGREAQAESYRAALTIGPGFRCVSLSDESAILAARLRVRYRLKLPDAFQLAVCLLSGCVALVTHDKDFRAVREIPIIGLDRP